jgi:thioredoxin 1
MKPFAKIAIVAALVILVATAFALKQATKATQPSVASPTVPAISLALPKLLDLGSDKCVPCKAMAPILEEMKKEYAGKLNIEFIDVWKNPDVAQKEMVEIIPTQIFYDANGKELFRHTGFFSKEDMLSKWKELGVDLTVK